MYINIAHHSCFRACIFSNTIGAKTRRVAGNPLSVAGRGQVACNARRTQARPGSSRKLKHMASQGETDQAGPRKGHQPMPSPDEKYTD